MNKQLLLLFVWLFACTTTHAQIITTVAGSESEDYIGDGAAATAAGLYNPLGVAVDDVGNIFIADTKHHCIRKVDGSGTIVTFAGTGIAGYSGDGGMATNALLRFPSKIAIDRWGNVIIADNGNGRIRKVSTSGIITTICGTGVTAYDGDGGPATNASIGSCPGLATDWLGNIWFSDGIHHIVRKIDVAGIITTVAGSGLSGYTGDGGAATAARLNEPFGIDVDGAGNLYIAEYRNNCIRKVSALGIISTLTAPITTGYSGDGGPATNAYLDRPFDVKEDGKGNVFIADAQNHVIRRIDMYGIIATVVGTNITGFFGDGGIATDAQLRGPSDVAIDNAGNLYIADYGNSRIRKVSGVVNVANVEKKEANRISLFPNPCNGHCSLFVSSENNYQQFRGGLFDVSGGVKMEIEGYTNAQYNLNLDFPIGLYMLTIVADNKIYTTTISILK